MNKVLKLWGIGMFSFGFIREWNSMIYKNRKENYSTRIMFSYLNGVYYTSPFGLVKLFHTYQRFNNDNNNNNNNSIYYEILGTNYEKIL